MINSFKNTAFIWTPHYQSLAFRVAKKNQLGRELNYIVVCCSKSYNGVYVWDAEDRDEWDTWSNNGNECYCVPVEKCRFLGELDKIKNPKVIAEVKKQQKRWLKYENEKTGKEKKKKPSWML